MRSFSADTRVLMADGASKPMSQLRIGDQVLAADPITGARGARRVLRVWVHDDTLLDLRIGRAGGTVTTTEDHPFWNATDAEWQNADAFDVGDDVLTADGDRVDVRGFRTGSAYTGLAYNLTVEGLHTYFVGAASEFILVHNTGGSYPINLGGGYRGRLDRFPMGDGVDFEVHVMRGRTEVGAFGSNGWFSKHRLGAPASVPSAVADRLKGVAVDEMRSSGRLGPKGTMDISGDKWMRPRVGAGC